MPAKRETKKKPYFPLFVDDFLSDEKLRECSASSAGVYIFLICLLHKMEEYGVILLQQKEHQGDDICRCFAIKISKHLPYDVDTIYSALTELLEYGVIHIDGNRLFQRRMVRDAEISRVRARSGSKGGNATREKFAADFATAKKTANCGMEWYGIGIDIDSKNGRENNAENFDEIFNSFWEAYPRKVGQSEARQKYQERLQDGYTAEDLLKAAKTYATHCKKEKTREQYIKHPKTFLGDNLPFLDYISKEVEAPEEIVDCGKNPFEDYRTF